MPHSGVCERLRPALHSLCCESTVVTLTLMSVLAISGEILIDYGILTAPADSQGQPTSTDSSRQQTQEVSSDTSANDRKEALETVQAVFHYLSLAIAGLFFIEMLVKIAAFRQKFFVQPWQVVDLVVVCASLAVEIAFEINGRLSELEVCTFIIIFRLWRLPHACNIKAQEMQRDLEQEIEVWKAGASKMQDRCNTLDSRNVKQKEKIERLEREITSLKKELKEKNKGHWKQDDSATVPNGLVPSNVGNSLSSGQHGGVADKDTLKPPMGHARTKSDDVDTLDGSSSGRPSRVGEEERDTEDDTLDEEDGEEESRRNYFRSGSESSLSCHAMEQEVHVQIEDEAAAAVASGKEEDNSVPDSPVQMRRKNTDSKDKKAWGAGTEVYYDNGGYTPDLDDGENYQGELLHEIDGARTYRSAEGIPMTDL